MMSHRLNNWTMIVMAGLILVGCAAVRAESHKEGVEQAVAVIRSTEGSNVRGVVRFYQMDEGVKIVADVTGLEPGQKHGFHIHTYGDMTAEDGTSAGGHYNPEGHTHGAPDADERHAGDLGNLQANANGFAHYERVDKHITIAGKKNPIVGRAVMVHAGEDTFVQPTGGAGARIGFGVIGVASANTVHVGLSDFEIQMPEKLSAGPTAFVVHNDADREHNLEFERGEWEVEFHHDLKPGETDVLFVNLTEGDYEVYCPIGDHAKKGMETELTVN